MHSERIQTQVSSRLGSADHALPDAPGSPLGVSSSTPKLRLGPKRQSAPHSTFTNPQAWIVPSFGQEWLHFFFQLLRDVF